MFRGIVKFWKYRSTAVVVSALSIIFGCGGGGGGGSDSANSSNVVAGEAQPSVSGQEFSGDIGPVTIDDDVVIPRNTTAIFEGTAINGNVSVLEGAEMYAIGASILGNVQAFGALLVDLSQQTFIDDDVQAEETLSVRVLDGTNVGGNIQIKDAPSNTNTLQVANAQVYGDVQAEKSSGNLSVTDSRIEGNLQFVENDTGPYEITDNRIFGDLQFTKNREQDPAQGSGTIARNFVDGNLQVIENDTGSYTITNNDVFGDLQFFKNLGQGTIADNFVNGNLQSKENSPAPFIDNNRVDGDLEIE